MTVQHSWLRLEYLTATGEERVASVDRSNEEFTRCWGTCEDPATPVVLRWDESGRTWREVRQYGLRVAHARMYPELKNLAEQRAWAEFDHRTEAEGVTIVERGQSWMPAPGGFPGTEMLEVWGLT